ncbi:MAG: putative tRNA(Ile)-lysidine synthetase [Pseudomonadota bacterium]
MDDSTSPRLPEDNPVWAPLRAWALQHDQSNCRWGVAYSGGADSVALLHAAAQQLPGRVVALHVNHGMQQAALEFEEFAQLSTLGLSVPLVLRRLQVQPRKGQSPEAAAREARYRALADMAQAEGLAGVWLAHHADDQLESILLALSRGAGLPGLSGMAREFVRHGVVFHRPMLDVSSQAVRSWLREAGLSHVHDPSNDDLRYTRNQIRHLMAPVLDEHFPFMAATAARSARHLAQAQAILEEVADADLQAAGWPCPLLEPLQSLSDHRLANVLRRWLTRTHVLATPSESQLLALMRQVRACQTRGHQIRLKVGQGLVVRHEQGLQWLPDL